MGITDPYKTVYCEHVLIGKNLEVLQTSVWRVIFLDHVGSKTFYWLWFGRLPLSKNWHSFKTCHCLYVICVTKNYCIYIYMWSKWQSSHCCIWNSFVHSESLMIKHINDFISNCGCMLHTFVTSKKRNSFRSKF